MSEEMKMSDLFDLPMFMDGASAVISNDHRYSLEFDVSDSNVGHQMELVCHAINNHDTLTEQVRKLTGDYQSLELQSKQWLRSYKEFDAQNKALRKQVRQLRESITDVNMDLIASESEVVEAYREALGVGCCDEECIHDVIKTYLEQLLEATK